MAIKHKIPMIAESRIAADKPAEHAVCVLADLNNRVGPLFFKAGIGKLFHLGDKFLLAEHRYTDTTIPIIRLEKKPITAPRLSAAAGSSACICCGRSLRTQLLINWYAVSSPSWIKAETMPSLWEKE